MKQFHVNNSRTYTFLYIVPCFNIKSDEFVCRPLCYSSQTFVGRWDIWIHVPWTSFAWKVPSRWTCPERPPEEEPSGTLRPHTWTSHCGAAATAESLSPTDSALIILLLTLTFTFRLITETLLHLSICAVHPFPAGEHHSYRCWLFHIHLHTIRVWPLLTLSGLMPFFYLFIFFSIFLFLVADTGAINTKVLLASFGWNRKIIIISQVMSRCCWHT